MAALLRVRLKMYPNPAASRVPTQTIPNRCSPVSVREPSISPYSAAAESRQRRWSTSREQQNGHLVAGPRAAHRHQQGGEYPIGESKGEGDRASPSIFQGLARAVYRSGAVALAEPSVQAGSHWIK